MSNHTYIACDLGAESGRIMLGRLENGKLRIEEIHRFSNGATRIGGTLRWDILRIYDELKAGLKKIAAQKIAADSISVDSWGVDYVLFNAKQPVLATPYHYRDTRTEAIYARVMASGLPALIFEETGIQFMALNTLYQFIAEVEENSDVLSLAKNFLPVADYLNFLFSGAKVSEESLASTTQIYNPRTRAWSSKIIELFGFPASLFPEIVPSGTKLGPLLADIAAETGIAGVEVVATCSHDTGAAVAAVPAQGDDWAYLSSGTWSLIGVELSAPLISEEVRERNYTNEAGIGGTSRFLKNVIGMWIPQECRRTWAKEGRDIGYEELVPQAAAAEPLRSLINPNAARFWKPDDMPGKIQAYCRETGQPVPDTPGQFMRCICESLALLYRQTIDELEHLTARTIKKLHIVGGGSKNQLLNQLTAAATGRTVIAGPVEATAIGNLLIQGIALGHLKNLAELREVVRESFPVQTYHPQDAELWQSARERFGKLDLLT